MHLRPKQLHVWFLLRVCRDKCKNIFEILTNDYPLCTLRAHRLYPCHPLYTGNPETGTLANGEDPNEMQHNAAFYQDLHCLRRLKQPSGTEIHHNLENSTCDPLVFLQTFSKNLGQNFLKKVQSADNKIRHQLEKLGRSSHS